MELGNIYITSCFDIQSKPPSKRRKLDFTTSVADLEKLDDKTNSPLRTDKGLLQSCGLTCVTQPQSANTPAVAKAKKKRRSKDKDSKSSNRRRGSDEEASSETRVKSLHKKVGLSDTWKLASDRSVARLLHSEHDTASFHGFNGSSAQDLPSDLTYVDASQVELGASESKDWLLTDDTTTDCDTTLVPHDDTSRQGAKTGLESGPHIALLDWRGVQSLKFPHQVPNLDAGIAE